jgi:serine/threonine-protein kinase
VRQDASLSHLADIWANRALSFNDDYDRAFYSPAIGITEKIVSRISLYHSPTGAYLTQALISNSRNDLHTLNKALKNFLLTAEEPCDKIDLTLGKAGLLIGCSLFYRELMTINGDPAPELILLAEGIKNEIWDQLEQYPPMSQPNPVDYFGIAHGWAGLLYSTLLWCNISSSPLPWSFMTRLEELLNNCIQQGNIIRWPLTIADKKSWPGWCNGSAGHIFLWVLLYKHFKDEKYIQLAEKAALHLISGIQNDNADLCCGMSGVTYAMISLYKATNEKKYLTEAKKIKDTILKTWFLQPLRNNSLYKGEPGIAVMVGELAEPSLMKIPLFE